MMNWRAMAAAIAVLCLGTPAASLAQVKPVTLAEVARAAQRHDVATLRQAIDDQQLVSEIATIDEQSAIDLQLSIARALDEAGDKANAIKAYDLAVARIFALRRSHDDLTQVDPLRRTAVLRRDLGDLTAAVADIDRAYAIAVSAKHPSLQEVRAEQAAFRAAFAAANPGAPPPRDYVLRGAGDPAPYDVVEVFYATHRKPTGLAEPVKFYGGDRGPLAYGKAYVSVPRNRSAGSLPTPSFWRGEFRPDPNRHIVLTDIKPAASGDQFFADLNQRVVGTQRKEVFVFIHGFNVSFEGGAQRAAQLAADLSIDGAPILYSWPSKASVLAYGDDEKEAEVASQIADLTQFLDDVARRSGADRVHLIAHSMGNRFLLRALNELAQRPTPAAPAFDEVVLAAPDVGVDDFTQRWPKIRPLANRYTLYASKRDRALMISGELHDMQRIGDARRVVVTAGLQTVETTAASGGLLGHADFAGSALDDFRGLIWYSLTPDKRCVLQTDQSGGQTFWVFAGVGACPEGEFREAVSMARTAGSPAAAAERVQAMIAQLSTTPSAASDLLLLRNVERLLLAFPVSVAPPPAHTP